MNFQDEQRINIKFCVHLHKLVIEIIKLLIEAYRFKCMAETMIHQVEFHLLKKPEWSTQMWGKNWPTMNIARGNEY